MTGDRSTVDNLRKQRGIFSDFQQMVYQWNPQKNQKNLDFLSLLSIPANRMLVIPETAL